jgi:inhibitor of KinA sporulation pathway (predicted exonuclease)
MRFTTIDLEMAQPSNKIIQIGACIGTVPTGEILGSISCFVKIDEPLTPYITNLTGITDGMLTEQGTSLLEAFAKVMEMHRKFKGHKSVIQWGCGDVYLLKKDLFAAGLSPKEWKWGYRHFDAKTLYQARCLARGVTMKGGLSPAMENMGLQFEGTQHNAMADAQNTFKLFCKLILALK